MEKNNFGTNLKKLRIFKNMERKELAESLNVAYSTLTNWENGVKEPDLKNFKKIASYFGVSTDYLLNHEIADNELLRKGEDTQQLIANFSQKLYEQYMSIPDQYKPKVEEELLEYINYLRFKTKANSDSN
ncbi:transcriptional regulator [Bacillus proteolyticus]|uniref:Transcriptional regulator n=1 Tax=Bacillus proteolyticus TaxID=2026192 RepID=A0AA44KU86_9BACI|nr:helix-turn-helix transcriptional regulator [Bacillus proteolyticus]OJE43037.1 transcriptional regulator [Bacillus proteolyticus]